MQNENRVTVLNLICLIFSSLVLTTKKKKSYNPFVTVLLLIVIFMIEVNSLR